MAQAAFKAFMYSLIKTNPELTPGTKITITTEELERHLQRAFEAGAKSTSDSRSLFDMVFGKS